MLTAAQEFIEIRPTKAQHGRELSNLESARHIIWDTLEQGTTANYSLPWFGLHCGDLQDCPKTLFLMGDWLGGLAQASSFQAGIPKPCPISVYQMV
jgi:hypothetical protein